MRRAVAISGVLGLLTVGATANAQVTVPRIERRYAADDPIVVVTAPAVAIAREYGDAGMSAVRARPGPWSAGETVLPTITLSEPLRIARRAPSLPLVERDGRVHVAPPAPALAIDATVSTDPVLVAAPAPSDPVVLPVMVVSPTTR